MAFDARQFLNALYTDPTAVAEITTPDDLPDEWSKLYEERAAIRHFDGGQALEHAEAEAFAEVVARLSAAENGS